MPGIRELRDEYPLTKWYNQCIDNAFHYAQKDIKSTQIFNWIDLGAGNGELAKLMTARFPMSSGVGTDFHDKPAALSTSGIKWLKADLNDTSGEPVAVLTRADLIFLITVVEHLLRPDIFLGHALQLLKAGGCLYLTTPRIDCTAFRLLKEKWPYIIMGEHLNIPSIKGMETLLHKTCTKIFGENNYTVIVKPVILPYPAGYYLQYFGLKSIAQKLPQNWLLRLPTGLLEAAVMLKSPADQG